MHTNRLLAALAVVFVSTTLLPQSVKAAGLTTPDLGAASLGKGAADVAAPDSLSALYYNPAGLAEQQGLRFLVDARVLVNQVHFQRTKVDPQSPKTFDEVSNTGAPLIAPSVGISYGFRWKIPFAIGLGMNPPAAYSGDRYNDYFALRQADKSSTEDSRQNKTFEQKSPQRYSLISQDTQALIFHLTLAAQPLPWLSVALQLQDASYHFKTYQALYLGTSAGENSGYDAPLHIDAKNGFQPTGALGVSAKLPNGFRVGGSFQLPTTIRASGTMLITIPQYKASGLDDPAQAQVSGNQADLSINLPWILRVGARFDRPLYSVELDGIFEAWSRYDALRLTPHDISVSIQSPLKTTIPVPQTSIPTGMQNAGSIRLGGELRAGQLKESLSFLKARAGLIYETSAVPLQYTSIMETNWDRLIPTVGIGLTFGHFDIDIAYAHVFQGDRTVGSDSQVLQSTAKGVTPMHIAAGDYSVQMDMLALSVGGHFL